MYVVVSYMQHYGVGTVLDNVGKHVVVEVVWGDTWEGLDGGMTFNMFVKLPLLNALRYAICCSKHLFPRLTELACDRSLIGTKLFR